MRSFFDGEVGDGSDGMNVIYSRPEGDDVIFSENVDTFRYYACENLWIVEDHTIFLPNDISIEDEIVEGDVVEVMGLLRSNNVLVADTIRLVR